MKGFSLSTQQHPEGGLVITVAVHVTQDEAEIIQKVYALGDELAPRVTPAPEKQAQPTGPEFYMDDLRGARHGETGSSRRGTAKR